MIITTTPISHFFKFRNTQCEVLDTQMSGLRVNCRVSGFDTPQGMNVKPA